MIEEREEKETQGIDIEAASAEISDELFGQGNDEDGAKGGDALKPEGEEAEVSGGSESADAPKSPPQQEVEEKLPVEGEENSAGVQAVGAPKSWNKEELATWATVPKDIQDKIAPILARREEDFFRGIEQYKGAADLGIQYSKVVEPYAPMLAAENVNPVDLFSSFASNHYILSRGTPEQKINLAAQLINGYQIPLGDLLEHIANSGDGEPVDPKFAALEKELGDLKGMITSRQSAEDTRLQEQIAGEIEAFAKDPAHPHFDELAADIQKLFGSGQAETLQEAYDKALLLNPKTRQSEIDRLTAEKVAAAKAEEEEKAKKRKRSMGDAVETTSKHRDGTVPKGSMDDTLNETMDAINSRA